MVKVVDFTLCALGHNKNVLEKNLTWGDLTFSGCKRVMTEQWSTPSKPNLSDHPGGRRERHSGYRLRRVLWKQGWVYLIFFFFFDLCFRSHLEMLHLLIIISEAWEGCREQAS